MSHELDFEPNRTELTYAAKLAWRNSTKCVGRLYWKGLQVFDSRESDTVDSIFDAMELHLKYGTNNGKIRSAVTVLKAFEINKSPKILSPQLIRYAGYRNPDGTVTGDPGNVEITEIALANGWRGENGNFDVLPLIIEDANGAIHMRELDKRNILEVQISHPEYSWFADLGIKWYALPAISNCCIDAFGKIYPIIMNGWYMGTEIGARNLADNYRYNLLPQIAKKMGVYRRDDVSLWKDKTLVELNIAVLNSFRAAGATIVDHHTAANEFMQFVEQEHSCGRRAETNWSWVVPPMSGATTPLFHLDFSNVQLKPAIVGYPETKEINRCPHV
jgi:nitric-oxide synthase